MAYIGKSPSQGVRNKYVYEATANQTAFTGADTSGFVLSVSDKLYTDVFHNGVLLKSGTDYSVTSTTVTLVAGALVDDVIEIITYDIGSVEDAVSASSGGTFNDRVNFTHGTHSNSVGSFINTNYNSNSNGVVHVKQTGATNSSTMVIEQTGEGGNPSDTQGLHIKVAGQNQGTGKIIRVTTTNSNLNSGTAYDPFTVTNGGELYIRNTSNAETLSLDQSGRFKIPKQPRFAVYKSGSEQFINTSDMATVAVAVTWNTAEVNIGSHFDLDNENLQHL